MVRTHSDAFDFRVLTSNIDWGESLPLDVEAGVWKQWENTPVLYVDANNFWKKLFAIVRGLQMKPSYLHLNSFFSPWFSLIPTVIARVISPTTTVVVAPRGEFGPAALAIKAPKKSLMLLASRLVGLHRNVWFHASSTIEEREIKAAFPVAKVVVRPNETALPDVALPPTSPSANLTRLCYIGRLSSIKGVDVLLKSLQLVTERVQFDFYGSSQDAHFESYCRDLSLAMPLNVKVEFRGAIDNAQVRSTFADYEAFLLPTAHENFGHAIAESLSASCPVLVCDVTPWSSVITNGGGWLVNDLRPETWAAAINSFSTLDPDSRFAMRLEASSAYASWIAGQRLPSVFSTIGQLKGDFSGGKEP